MKLNNEIKHFINSEYFKLYNYNDIKNISQLKGGTTSLVYLIETFNFKKYVIKIENSNDDNLLSIEKNTLWWEAKMLQLMEKLSIPSPKLIKYQKKNDQSNYSYIIMNFIDGVSYGSIKKSCSQEEKKYIETQIGEICKKISSVSGKKFFIPISPDRKFNNNYEFVLYLFQLLLMDAKRFKINIGEYSFQDILDILKNNEAVLNNINRICLVHSDAWDGNILIDDEKINIIDFSDLYFCDELMTFYFHSLDSNISNDFLIGYGKKNLNSDEIIRIRIYRLFVLIKMYIEKEIKKFNNKDNLTWIYEKINFEMNLLNGNNKFKGGIK